MDIGPKKVLISKRKPTRTNNINVMKILKLQKNTEKEYALLTERKKLFKLERVTPNREMHSKLTQKVVHIRKFSH